MTTLKLTADDRRVLQQLLDQVQPLPPAGTLALTAPRRRVVVARTDAPQQSGRRVTVPIYDVRRGERGPTVEWIGRGLPEQFAAAVGGPWAMMSVEVACVQAPLSQPPPCVIGGPYDTEAECLASGCVPTVTVDCCGTPVPGVVTVTVSGKTGDCTCLPDSFQLQWNGVNQWTNQSGVTLCGNNQPITFGCNPGGTSWTLGGAPSPACSFGASSTDFTCDPFSVTFTGVSITGAGCCTGTATFVVTG